MDEKTDVLSSDQLPASDADSSAGIGTDGDFLPASSTGTDSVISTASTDTDTAISTDTLTDILSSTEAPIVSDKTEVSEVSATDALPPTTEEGALTSDAVSVADALTSVDGVQSAEELSSENTKIGDEDITVNKVSSPETKPSLAVCELEEELKRLHEGDPTEDPNPTDSSSIKDGSTNDKSAQEKTSTSAESQQDKSVTDKRLTDEQSPQKEVLDPVEMLTAADDASKDPVLIKNAQEDIKKIDVLVCGSCHEVFHFIEEFKAHQSGKCSGVSNILAVCEGESKPQVWGFTLWKNKQQKLGEKVPSSWVIYQKWCKLPQIDKDAWITAGQTLQFCTKIGYAKITENKPQIAPPQTKQAEKDPLALDGFADSNKENSVVGNKAVENKQNTSEVIKKSIVKPVRLNNDVTILPSTKVDDKNGESNSNKAIRTIRSTEKREYVVERIVAKRFNPKRKTWEYQIKWENFPSEDNTWEPISNLNHCKQMVEEFEQQLKKLKAEKAKQQATTMSPKPRGKSIKMPQILSTPGSSFSSDSTPGRPQRTSKQKALNQVKAWCGNISDADEGGVKRSFEDDDSDDSFEKKMKYEDYSDDSDVDVKPKITQYKKIAPKPPTMQIIKNGVGKPTPLPQNVLIPDANGVVRINQKQLPSLSTGVYIMSKTAGIIKLDSTTSKVATSGGQTIVKVAPKIGQTQIKIVKKDGATTTTKQIIQVAPTKTAQSSSTKIYKPIITKVKKPSEMAPKPIPTKITVRPKEEPKKEAPVVTMADDSDDGLEELPFPDDLPLPEPESPPRDFVLDPFTGKIAGQEYPESEPESEVIKSENDETSLENIVKLAAADITEDDLKNGTGDTPMETEPIPMEQEEAPINKTESITSVTSASSTSGTPVKVTMTSTLVKSEPSLLNKALSSSAILRKSLLNTSPQPKVQQRILNQSIASRTHNVSSVVRSVSHGSNLVRTRPIAPRPKFNIAGHSNIIRSQHETSPKNVYSKSTLSTTRKIGNTTIRSAAAFTGHRPQARIVQTSMNIHKASPKKESLLIRSNIPEKTLTPPKPKTVISMPSLIGDDEPSLSPPTSEAAKSPTLPATTSSTSLDTSVVTPVTSEPSVETPVASAADAAMADISSFTLADNENPIFITGDDGTVYQVAGQNEQGQTILLTQGSDGQQQCLLVTNEVAEAMETTTEEPQPEISMPEISADVTEPLSVKTDDSSDQVVAQVVRAEPPSPGGTHKVVVMLPDGNLMVTQVSPEEYASLELE